MIRAANARITVAMAILDQISTYADLKRTDGELAPDGPVPELLVAAPASASQHPFHL